MASPSMEDLYHKSCALAEDPQELRDGFQHPARLVKVKWHIILTPGVYLLCLVLTVYVYIIKNTTLLLTTNFCIKALKI